MQHDFLLLDRSGSMESQWVEALSSINAYVHKLAEEKVDTEVSLITFDHHGGMKFEHVRTNVKPETWIDVSSKEASPRGTTPLNDAVGKLVTLANEGCDGKQFDKAALIIMTDGWENASQEFSHQGAKTLLEKCRQKGWQVIFLGANFDAVEQQAASYGTVGGQAVYSTAQNMGATMSIMAAKRGLYGSNQAATMSWSDDEKAAAAKDEGNGG